MGSLLYGNPGTEISFDDRALMHLQVVITAKLRRRESFLFTWMNSPDVGSGRSSIWLDQTSSLLYRFAGSRTPSLNRDWIELSANSAGGLYFSPEPTASVQPSSALPVVKSANG
jgi:hypothetical protein